MQHRPQTHLQAGCRTQKCIHPCTATFLGRPGRCAALTTDTSSGHRDELIPTRQLPQVYQVTVLHLPQIHLQATEIVIPILPCSLVHQVTVQLLPQTYRQAGCRPQRCGHPHTAMLPGTPAHWTAALLYCNTHSYVLDECLEHCCSEKPAMTDGKWQQATATKYQLFMLKSLLTSLKMQ